ncbi:MAG: TlpA disulfide reductase family protein [Pseudomonadota bacterium]|nr:TlpA disulfide reductase family protein [Pseudomonadota bacterium]
MSGAPGQPPASPASAAAHPATRRWTLAAVAVLAAAAGAGVAWRRLGLHAPPAGAQVEGFWQHSFATPAGDTLALASLRGRPLLVNFWATWCPPCVQELPLLSRFYDENKANGWQLLGLAVDKPEAVQRFLARTPVSFPVALAGLAGTDVGRLLGNTAGGLPFSVLFDADGQLRQRKLGQLHAADLAQWRKIAPG